MQDPFYGSCLLARHFAVRRRPECRSPLKSAAIQINLRKEVLPVFTDVTKAAGVDYKIICGDDVTEYLIDVNGEGAAFFDYDNDGDLDIYLANGSSRQSIQSGKLPHDYLLRNNGDGTFKDVTAPSRLGDTEWSSGVAVGDIDNDGYLDLYLTNFGPNKLYRNNGDGTFTEKGERAGVADPHWGFPKWSMGAAFGDIDNDGYLDLYVCNFTEFNYQKELPPPSKDSPCKMKTVPIACAPEKYNGTQGLLYEKQPRRDLYGYQPEGWYHPEGSGQRLCGGLFRLR